MKIRDLKEVEEKIRQAENIMNEDDSGPNHNFAEGVQAALSWGFEGNDDPFKDF